MLTNATSNLELQNCTTTAFVSKSVNKSSTNAICRDILRKLGQVVSSSSSNSPTPSDVLCGRGKMSVDHPGNKTFRSIIALHLDTYLAIRHRRAKTILVADLVKTLREYGVKFIKKDPKSGGWIDVGNQEACKKVGHAFRDAHSERKVRNLRLLLCASCTNEEDERQSKVVVAGGEKSNTTPMMISTNSSGKRNTNSGSPSTSLLCGDYHSTTSSPDAHSVCLDYQPLSQLLVASTTKEERYQQPSTTDDDLLFPFLDWDGSDLTVIDEDLEEMAISPSASNCTTSMSTVNGLDKIISLLDMNTTTTGLAELEKFLLSGNEDEVNGNYVLSAF